MARSRHVLLALLLACLGGTVQATSVHDVRLEGATRLDVNTVLFYSTLKPGEIYSEQVAREDFKKLWGTGFFKDLRLELEEAGDDEVDLVWHVVERPVLESLTYEGNEGITDEDIESVLSDLGVELTTGSPFGLGQLERARTIIEQMFNERGYRFVDVKTQVTEAADGGQNVVILIDEGSKVKITKIEFEGNRAFSDDDLRDVFKKTKQTGFWCFISKHCVFNDANFNEDLEKLKEHYFNRGYIQFQTGEPEIESTGEGKDRRLSLRVPVNEGVQYRVGAVKVEGNTAYPEELLLAFNKLELGEPFSREKMLAARESISELYGYKGYFNVFIAPRFDPTDVEDIVDVTYKITENEKYYVHRIEFRGNTSTKDKVIRRQLRMTEGSLFNTALFKRSLLRIQQLGYFSEPQPKIEPSEEDPTRLNVTIDLQEQGRNDIRFGGGVSGVEGFFGTFAFSTRNLFGSGNSLTVDLQAGRQVKQYRLAYSDPWILDKPISGGLDLFNRFIDYGEFDQESTGGIAQFGFPFKDFFFFRTSYRYEEVDQKPSERKDADGNVIPPTETETLLYTDNRRVSAVEPVLIYSSVDNPVRPWRGFRQIASVEYSGGPLGGTSNILKPRFDTTLYIPVTRRVNLAFHGEVSWVKGFGDGEASEVPLFEKFFLGGERSLRGYRAFQVGPRETQVDIFGNESDVLIGGDKMLQLNTELKLRVADPVSLVLFADAGNAFDTDESISFSNLKTSFGAEVRFWTPFLQAPLRLIWSYVPEPLVRNGVEDPKTDFTFSIGTTF